jgi:Ca2+-transporting ATPase
MALSSLPPDPRVMRDKPRSHLSQIIDGNMGKRILGYGLLFFLFLFGLWQLLWHCDISSVHDLTKPEIWNVYVHNFLDFSRSKQHLSAYELGVFFTFFVMLQFWNLFNARYYRTGRSLVQDLYSVIRKPATLGLHYSKGFILIVLAIFVGQVLIVNVFGEFFSVSALRWNDWLWILIITSPILIVSDFVRLCLSRLSRMRYSTKNV